MIESRRQRVRNEVGVTKCHDGERRWTDGSRRIHLPFTQLPVHSVIWQCAAHFTRLHTLSRNKVRSWCLMLKHAQTYVYEPYDVVVTPVAVGLNLQYRRRSRTGNRFMNATPHVVEILRVKRDDIGGHHSVLYPFPHFSRKPRVEFPRKKLLTHCSSVTV